LQFLEDGCGDPADMVGKLDAFLGGHLEVGQFVTMFVGLLDPETGRMEYVNAGHVHPFLLGEGTRRSLSSTGPPVAILPEPFPRTAEECVLEPNSTLLVFSDGVTENGHETSEQYGEGPMQAYLERAYDLGAEDLVRGLLNDTMAFGNGKPVDDDLTLLAIRRE
jgi:serine phosphatase RsbU (regulator of sigma subunit)